MFKIFGLVAILGSLIAIAIGSAATLNVEGSVVQAGEDGSLWCDGNGVTVDSYILNDIPGSQEGVLGIRIKDVDPACAGARMFLRLDDGAGNVLAYSKPESGACYGVSNWVIAQTSEPTLGYVFTTVDGGRTTEVTVDPADIEKIKFWIEGKESDGTEC